MSEWTDKDVATLKELWPTTLSTTQIGDALSRSRRSVSSAAIRYGLPPRPKKLPDTLRQQNTTESPPKPYAPKEPEKPIEPATLPDGSHYTMATIGPHQCRFLFGEVGTPDFHLCGNHAVGSWCVAHRALCFNTETMRRTKAAATA